MSQTILVEEAPSFALYNTYKDRVVNVTPFHMHAVLKDVKAVFQDA